MHKARAIAQTPLQQWAAQIAVLPDSCEHADCGAPRSCRKRIAEYLRVQYVSAQRLQRTVIAKGAGQ